MKKLLVGVVLFVFVLTMTGCFVQCEENQIVEDDRNDIFFDIETAADYMRSLFEYDPNLIVQYQRLSDDNFVMFARVDLTIDADDDGRGAAAYTTIQAMLVVDGKIVDWLWDVDTGEFNRSFWEDLPR